MKDGFPDSARVRNEVFEDLEIDFQVRNFVEETWFDLPERRVRFRMTDQTAHEAQHDLNSASNPHSRCHLSNTIAWSGLVGCGRWREMAVTCQCVGGKDAECI